jgi:hypothetical protein
MEQKGPVKGFDEKKLRVAGLLNVVESVLCPAQQIGYTDDIMYSYWQSLLFINIQK